MLEELFQIKYITAPPIIVEVLVMVDGSAVDKNYTPLNLTWIILIELTGNSSVFGG